MNTQLTERSIDPLIIALVFSVAIGLSHAAGVNSFPQNDSDELKRYLSSHNYRTPESCTKSADKGSCWARSIMSVLSEQELSQIFRQQAERLEYPEGQPVNAAALHIYLESHSAETPEGATPGIPINNLNTQLAILLKKKILTITPLAGGSIATQIFTGFEDGSYEVEENIISLSEEPETLFTALITADISLFLTPGVNAAPGHVQPVVFNLQAHQTSWEALPEDSLNSMINRPARALDLFAVSSGDIPPYFFSALQFGVKNDQNPHTQLSWGSKELEKKAARERAAAKKRLNEEVKQLRSAAAREYRKSATIRSLKSFAVGALKSIPVGFVSGAIYQNWETVKAYLQDFQKEIIAPNLPLMARLDGMGMGKSEDMPPEWASFIDTLPKKGHEALKYIRSKVDNDLRSRWSNVHWFNPHGPNFHPPEKGIKQPVKSFSDQMLMAVNAIRSKPQVCGNTVMSAVGRLRWNYSLEAAAFRHATDMANGDFMSHSGSDGSQPTQRVEAQGYLWSTTAENVAAGQRSVDAVLKAWMSSEGHCKNIMSPGVTEMGVSFVEKASGKYGIFWAQVFASPRHLH